MIATADDASVIGPEAARGFKRARLRQQWLAFTLVVPLALAMIGIGVWGQLAYGDPVPWPFLLRALAISAALLVRLDMPRTLRLTGRSLRD